MERRLKERLIGAAVLVILAVLLIPQFLTGPPRDAVEQSALSLPEPTLRRHIVRIDEPAVPSVQPSGRAPEPHAAPKPEPAPVPATVSRTDPVQSPSTEATTAEAAAPKPESPRPVSTMAGVDRQSGWVVQVGSFSSQSNARRLEQQLKSMDYPAFVVRNVVDGRVMYRVRIGPEPEESMARALASRLRDDGQQTTVVRHP